MKRLSKSKRIITRAIFGILVFSLVFPAGFEFAAAQSDSSSMSDSFYGNLPVVGGLYSSYNQFKKAGAAIAGFKLPTVGNIITGVGGWVIEWIIFYLFWLLSLLASVVFSFGGWLIEVLLKFNMQVLELPTVLVGWEIVLSITNLGFVLAIIVIAFATIFRFQSYAMKQILWKLVVAALLVNFSLVIAGGFIEFSHILANFLINEATPSGSASGISAFAESLANSFAPQKLLDIKNSNDALDIFKKIAKDSTIMIISIGFVFVFTSMGALMFFTIAIMLLIRFVVLGILLILAPIVWLFWIFPATVHLWHEWWNKFIRWVFFAPAMLFFLYLVVKTNEVKGNYFNSVLGAPAGSSGGQAIKSQFSSLSKALEGYVMMRDPVEVLGEMVIMLGLMMGGLIAANKLSITFSTTANNWAKSAGKGIGVWAGRKGLQWGTAPVRAGLFKDEEGKRTVSVGSKLTKVANKSWLGRHTIGYLARGVTRLETAGGENLLKKHEKSVGGMSDSDLKTAYSTASGPRKIVAVKELKKRKLLGDIDVASFIADKSNRNLFGRFRQDFVWGDIEKGAKMNQEMAQHLKYKEAKDSRYNEEAFDKAIKKFVGSYLGKDVESSAIKDLYGGKAKLGLTKDTIEDFSKIFAEAMATENHSLVAKLIPTFKTADRDRFDKIYAAPHTDEKGRVWYGGVLGGLPETFTSVTGKVKKREDIEDAYKKTMANYSVGYGAESAATTAAPATPTT